MVQLRDHFQQVLRDYTAGDPMRENVHWTNLTQQQIADGLELAGTSVSTFVVRQLLDEHHYVKRQAQKKQPLGRHPDRDAQFQRIGQLRDEYQAAGQPVLSIDVKKKELLGDFYRPGACYASQPQVVLDHDFPSFASGKVIPHGIYDLAHNRGHMTLGVSHDTSQFACDCLLLWWKQHGQSIYASAKRLLLLCDTGGSNSCGYRFKADLQRVADQTGLEIRVAHYPPYASKYNPIEHRLFPHITRACRGAIFRSLEFVRELMLGTHTETGLDVTVEILKNLYETGRKVSQQLRDSLQVVWDEQLPKWNYKLMPGRPF